MDITNLLYYSDVTLSCYIYTKEFKHYQWNNTKTTIFVNKIRKIRKYLVNTIQDNNNAYYKRECNIFFQRTRTD